MSQPADALELLRRRRSVRQFLDAAVDDAAIRRLLEAARLAPSGHNRQPWRFAVVRDPARRASLAEAMATRLRHDRLADGTPPAIVEADVVRSRDRLLGAPALILVCLTMSDMDDYPDTHRSKAEFLMAVQSVAMAGENLLLAAAAEGLGACWMCGPLFAGDEARRALDLPPDWEPQGAIVLGSPREVPKLRGRLGIDTVTRWL